MLIDRLRGALIGIAAGLTAGATASAVSQEFYAGKTINVLSGYAAGSAYYDYALLTRNHLGKHLPGNPKGILKAVPGAAGLVAANYLYEVAPPDGLTIGALSRGVAAELLVQGQGSKARFDPRKYLWLGSLNNEVSVGISWHQTGIAAFDDVYSKELLVAGSTVGDAGVFALVMNEVLGTKFKMICCYQGSAEQDLAMERGETGGRLNVGWAHIKRTKPDWLAERKVNLLVQLALNKHADLPEVPLVMDLVKDAEGRKIMEVVFSRQSMGRPFAAPPGMPADRARELQTAFERMMKDPEFLADADRAGIEVNDPLNGPKVQALVESLHDISDATSARLRRIFEVSGRQ